MNSTNFEFIDRGKTDSIVLIPGWATDYRIFNSLELAFNYLIPVHLSPYTFEEALVAALEDNNLSTISLFGWSMGGFLAYEFAIRNISLVDELILVGIRWKYKKEEINEVEEALKARKKGYLNRFFSDCFYGNHITESSKNLLREYCRDMELDYLLDTLDYLSKTEIKPELLQQIQKITIIHGEKDRIAPISEAVEIKDAVNNARFILVEESGHIPFLEENFRGVF